MKLTESPAAEKPPKVEGIFLLQWFIKIPKLSKASPRCRERNPPSNVRNVAVKTLDNIVASETVT